ncbi:MAG: Ig-like domain-containing protein [Myxococcaceae bacterium]
MRGEIGVVYDDASGSKLTSRDAVYDFGSVFMGQKQPMKLTIKNLGRGTLTLDKLEKESGAAVSIGELAEENPVFDVRFLPSDVASLEVIDFDMTFNAPQDPVLKVVEHEVKLILRGVNTDPGAETATITLKARAVSGVCELPKVIDFGAVAKGDSFKMTQDIANPSELEATATVGDIYSSSGDNLAFSFTADSARGTINIPPSSKRTVSISFSPTDIKSYLAFVKMRASAQCPEFAVSLTGRGVDSVLIWSCDQPARWDATRTSLCDFGYVPPGTEVTRELTFKNAGNAEASLAGIKTLLPGEFKVVPEAGQDPTKLIVPGKDGEKKLSLSFKPAVLGPRSTTLSSTTNLLKQPNIQVQLKGYGGGPAIQVIPSPTLNFGKVAYFPGAATPVFQTRKLTIMNVGTKPAVSDPTANLHLGTLNAKPYVSIVPMNADSDLSEISIPDPALTGPNSYNPAVGLEASAGKNLVDLVVKLTPASAKPKQFEVTVYSNDPSKPAVKVVVSADAQELPPCNYEVTPTALNYGLVTPPSYRDLAFTIKNLGQNVGDLCLLSNLDIDPTSNAIFSLPAGPIASRELQPGEILQVLVRAWPQGTVPSTVVQAMGSVLFYMSSPTVPQKNITLQASIAAGCLTVAPDDLDFGTVQRNCNSSTKTFSIYNTCTANVVISSFAMQAVAGEPAGGPNCAGTSPCPEFMMVSTPAIPTGGLAIVPGGAPTTFSAKYKPINLGPDSGAIAINAIQGGQNVTYVITLQGKGDTVGLNTDIYTQDSKPKADILLVIDNSCSMYDKQVALATNFSSFIKYAVAAAVDYHISATTTDMDSGGELGKMIGDTSNPKVLTPTTVDVENKFKLKVNLGITGSGSEEMAAPALAALTAPLITSDNAGFLRNDAALAVVVVTDAEDQSPQPTSFYYNALMNVKGVKRANMFTYNVIGPFNPTGGTSGCGYDGSPDDGRHAMMVSQTNGVKEEICTPDWAKSLEQLGKTAFGFRTNFFLNGTPDLTGGKAIEVKIDGITLPNVDVRGSTVWTYDAVANSVNFEPMFVPEPGQTMTITYYVTCF